MLCYAHSKYNDKRVSNGKKKNGVPSIAQSAFIIKSLQTPIIITAQTITPYHTFPQTYFDQVTPLSLFLVLLNCSSDGWL